MAPDIGAAGVGEIAATISSWSAASSVLDVTAAHRRADGRREQAVGGPSRRPQRGVAANAVVGNEVADAMFDVFQRAPTSRCGSAC